MKRLLFLTLLLPILTPAMEPAPKPPVYNPPSLKFLSAHKAGQAYSSEELEEAELPQEIKEICSFMEKHKDLVSYYDEVAPENIDAQTLEFARALEEKLELTAEEIAKKLTDANREEAREKALAYTQTLLSAACHQGILTQSLLDDLYTINPHLEISNVSPHSQWSSPINLAAVKGHTKTILLLLSRGVSIEDREGYDKRTPLITVAMASEAPGRLTTLQFLLEKGAHVNAKNLYGETALHHTVERGLVEETKLLLAHKADINEPNSHQKTPLYMAVDKKNLALMQILLEAGATIDPQSLEKCFSEKFKEGIVLLKKFGADINILIHGQMTALHEAILWNNIPFATFLLGLGADPNVRGLENETALLTAICQKNTEAVRILLTHDANPHVTNRFNEQTLTIALARSACTIASLLLDHGAALPEDISIRHLSNVAAAGDCDLLQRLLDAGAYSIIQHSEFLRSKLLEKAANITVKDFIESYHQQKQYELLPWYKKKLVDTKRFIKDHKKAITITAASTAVGAGIWYWLKNKEK